LENVLAYTGAPLAAAVRMASTNAARMLGVEGVGELRVGDAADLNRFDAKGRLVGSYLRGVEVVRAAA